MGQTCNINKSTTLSSTRVYEALLTESGVIPGLAVNCFLKYLGAALSFRQDHGTRLLKRRFADAMTATDRVDKLLSNGKPTCASRKRVLPKAVVSGAEFRVLPRAMQDELAAKVCCTTWRMRRRCRAREIFCVLFAAAHDPWSCAAYCLDRRILAPSAACLRSTSM